MQHLHKSLSCDWWVVDHMSLNYSCWSPLRACPVYKWTNKLACVQTNQMTWICWIKQIMNVSYSCEGKNNFDLLKERSIPLGCTLWNKPSPSCNYSYCSIHKHSLFSAHIGAQFHDVAWLLNSSANHKTKFCYPQIFYAGTCGECHGCKISVSHVA